MNAVLNIQPGAVFSPGVLLDINGDEYHRSPGVSRSGLQLLKEKTPYHFWYKYVRDERMPEKKTDALVYGSALHTHLLEPETFNDRFFVIPHGVHGNSNEAKEIKRQNWRKSLLPLKDKYEIFKIRENIFRDRQIAQLLDFGLTEKSIYWVDPETGLLCKIRPDFFKSGGVIVDIKSTADAHPSEFQHSICKYGYDLQAAMMREGLKHGLGMEMKDFILLAIEKEEPFAHGLYFLDDFALDRGYREFRKYLNLLAYCYKNNYWPSYECQEISLPGYAFKQ